MTRRIKIYLTLLILIAVVFLVMSDILEISGYEKSTVVSGINLYALVITLVSVAGLVFVILLCYLISREVIKETNALLDRVLK